MPGHARSSGVRGFSLERFCLIGESNPIKNKKTFYHYGKRYTKHGQIAPERRYNQLLVVFLYRSRQVS